MRMMSNIKLVTLQPDNLRRAWQYLRNDKALWAVGKPG